MTGRIKIKSTPRSNSAGNIKLKGKKSKLLICGCCEAYNLKDYYFKKIHKNEIKNYFRKFTEKDGEI